MSELRGRRAPRAPRPRIDPVSQIDTTLREYYEAKRAQYAVDFPTTYDRELRKVFSDAPNHAGRELASAFIQRHRTEIRRTVARWTGEYEFALDQLLRDMIGRCRELVRVGAEQVLLGC
jgi:hypothetical protein